LTTGTEQAAHPGVPHDALEGTHWVIKEPDGAARLAPEGKHCRYRGSKDPQACGAPAVIEVRRGVTRVSWWGLCGDPGHSGGYWIEDGRVVHWALEPLP
jgi:hypothetical protein